MGSSCTCLNHLGIRWEVEKIETSLINNIFKHQALERGKVNKIIQEDQ
jgi:hypothetical protein